MLRHADVVCLCLVCILWQLSMLNDLQFVNVGRGCKSRLYGRGILQSRSHDCLIGTHACVYFCLTHPVAVSDFIICSSLCACTEML